MTGIVESKKLNPSLKANNPNDCFYGEGQYLSDIVPGTKSPAKLSRSFIHNPFQGAEYDYYVEIDVTDLDVVYGRDNVFVILNQEPLDLMDRIVYYGMEHFCQKQKYHYWKTLMKIYSLMLV